MRLQLWYRKKKSFWKEWITDARNNFLLKKEKMNKAEKALVIKVKNNFISPKTAASFMREENMILEKWRTLGIINEDAFIDCTTMNSGHKEYLQNLNFPFTNIGEQEINKNWYMHFRESKGITILRDVLTVIAFLVSLYLAISKFFPR